MARDFSRGPQFSRSRRKSRQAGRRRLAVGLLALVAFAAGFLLLWMLTGRLAGGGPAIAGASNQAWRPHLSPSPATLFPDKLTSPPFATSPTSR